VHPFHRLKHTISLNKVHKSHVTSTMYFVILKAFSNINWNVHNSNHLAFDENVCFVTAKRAHRICANTFMSLLSPQRLYYMFKVIILSIGISIIICSLKQGIPKNRFFMNGSALPTNMHK